MGKILVVDDHPANREFLSTLLSYKDHQTCEAGDGAEALERTRAERPDLIITDILMPTMDGYEFVRQLRLDPAIANTVVIFCTADYQEQEAQRLAGACGVTDVLIKPCEPELVLRTVDRALGLATDTPPSPPPQEFDREHLRLMTNKLSQKTLELQNANLRLAALIDISLQLADEPDPSRLLESMCLAARRLISSRFCAVAAGPTDAATPEHFFTAGIDADSAQCMGEPALHEGLLGAMLEQRRACRIADVAADTVVGLPSGFPVIRCLLAVPIVSPQHAYGWLCLGDKVDGASFSDEDERMLTILGAQVGRMYENAVLYAQAQDYAAALEREAAERRDAQRKLQAQLGRLALLHQITRAIGERQDLRSIFQVVIRSLEDSMPIDFGCVCLYDPAAAALIVTSVGVRSAGLATQLAMSQQARIPVDENGLSRCMRGHLVHEPDTRNSLFPLLQRLAAAGLSSLVTAPLLAESRVFGVLVTARRQADSFSSGDCEFLRQVSEHVALAAHQAQLYAALQQAYEDLRHSQHTVMQQERLKALGQMASGVAHDINNAISPIALYTESLLERDTTLSERARTCLVTIQHAIDGVAQTVSRMREFYRPSDPQQIAVRTGLNALVQQVVEFSRARWSDVPQQRGVVIDVRTQLETDLPDINGLQSELRDTLTNLVFNGVDAMPEGGTLTIRTCSTGDTVTLEVSDTGVGMDETTRQHCLEPFFTTKGERGTGLGLAMVYGMAQRHGAELSIESTRGEGTTMRLLFPIARLESERASWPPTSGPLEPLSILIVDDDPLIIQSLRDALERDGHAITAADGGRAGIDTLTASQPNAFAVVITDLGMPYVDGRRVAAAVKTHSPQTPVILLTGWGRHLDLDDIPPHVDRVLSKPPKLAELRRALAELTAARGAEA